MTVNRDHLEMAFHSITCFADDGRLEAAELDRIVAIAERDGTINDDESRVLNNIISRIQPDEIDSAMKVRLDALRRKLGPVPVEVA
ncbi:hypothetical protein [Lysobacter sp. A3-1-A15]|uniref:hypothetical protein n=1 Tax=Novilysobacter viscosus TaxID=3098602 RepID=UPI002ED7832A